MSVKGIASAAQMRRLDQYAIRTLGIPGTLLMEHAAAAVADAVCAFAGSVGTAVAVCCPGNNGGDGIGCAYLLRRRGWQVRCFLVGERGKLTPDSAAMCRTLESEGGRLERFDAAALQEALKSADIAVDALFGTGLNAPLRGDALAAVQLLNASKVPVVACDLPSGVAADTGEVLGDAVEAALTVTFTAAKPGLLLPPGMSRVGKLQVADICIPAEALATEHWLGELPDAAWIADLLPPRRVDTHKGDYGRILLLWRQPGPHGSRCHGGQIRSSHGRGADFPGRPGIGCTRSWRQNWMKLWFSHSQRTKMAASRRPQWKNYYPACKAVTPA